MLAKIFRGNPLVVFVMILAIGFTTHLVTIGYSPLPWQDEVEILDLGQGGIVDKSSGWSVCVNQHDYERTGKFNAWGTYYLGGVVQESAYFLLGRFGPRCSALLGLLGLTFLSVAYFMRKTGNKVVSFVITLLLIFDPLVTKSVRGARVDVFCFVLCFGELLLLSYIGQVDKWKRIGLSFLCGCLLAIQFFVWASALMLIGLLFFEIIEQYNGFNKDTRIHTAISCSLSGFVGMCMGILCLISPLALNGADIIGNTMSIVSLNTSGGFSINKFQTQGLILLKLILSDPFVFILGIWGGVRLYYRWWPVLLWFVFFLLYAVGTRMYEHRYVYFVPFLCVGMIGLVAEHSRCSRVLCKLVLCVAVFFSFGRSIVLRNGIEFLARGTRSHQKLCKVLEEVCGREVAVYIDTYQVYYAGRELGWQMYRDNFFDRCKFVIVEKKKLTDTTLSALKKKGFSKVIDIDIPYETSCSAWVDIILNGAGHNIIYGPYIVLQRMDGNS